MCDYAAGTAITDLSDGELITLAGLALAQVEARDALDRLLRHLDGLRRGGDATLCACGEPADVEEERTYSNCMAPICRDCHETVGPSGTIGNCRTCNDRDEEAEMEAKDREAVETEAEYEADVGDQDVHSGVEAVGRACPATGRGPQPVAAKAARPPVVHVRLGHALQEGLRAECRRTGAPASEVVRRALSRYLG